MNLLARLERKILFERLVIGLEEPILVKGVGKFQAKIDSGNGGYNVIHGTDAYQEGDVLHFHTEDSEGNPKHVAAKIVDRIQVNIGGGHIQDRPVINLDVKFANTLYKGIPFSVTDRADNDFKVLISKQFVDDELDALIDVGERNISGDNRQVELVGEAKGIVGSVVGGVKKGVDGALDSVGKGLQKISKANPGGLFKKIAKTSDQIRKGEYEGSLLLGPAKFVLGLAGRIIDNKFLRTLGWSGAVLAAAIANPMTTIFLTAGYGLAKLATMRGRYNRSYMSRGYVNGLRGSFNGVKKTTKRAFDEISERNQLLASDKQRIRKDFSNRAEDIKKKASAEGVTGLRVDGVPDVIPVMDYNSLKGDGQEIGGDDQLNNMRAIILAGQQGCLPETNKAIDGEFGEHEETLVVDALSRLLFQEATGGLLLESEADGPDVEPVEGGDDGAPSTSSTPPSSPSTPEGDDKDTPKNVPDDVAKALEEFQRGVKDHSDKLVNFLESYLFNKRQFILYYVETVQRETDDFQQKLLESKYDTDMSNIVKVMEPLNPKIFEGLLKKYSDEFNRKEKCAEERYGYFVLCYGKRDKRQLKVYEDYNIVQKAFKLEELFKGLDLSKEVEAVMRDEFEKLFEVSPEDKFFESLSDAGKDFFNKKLAGEVAKAVGECERIGESFKDFQAKYNKTFADLKKNSS